MKKLLHRESINLAVKHYSSLFHLPSPKKLLLTGFLMNLLLGFLASLFICLSLNFTILVVVNILVRGVLLGLIIYVLTLFSDYLLNKLLSKQDIIFRDLKRVIFLSVVSSVPFIIFTMAGLLFGRLSMDFYVKVLSLGLYASFSLRLLVIDTICFANRTSKAILSAFQPILLLLLLMLPAAIFRQEELYFNLIYPPALALVFSVLSVQLFRKALDMEGERMLGIPSLRVAKAFIANWAEGAKEPFEEILERLGEKRTISISALVFRRKGTKELKALIIVPSIHPGPFKNVGSSLLPSIIEETLEREFQCIVSVPHGISGHELDLSSQAENEKVIKSLVSSLKEVNDFSSKATKFFMVEGEGAKVGCQVFNNCTFITLTTSPETMEDLPLELNEAIVKKALDCGFSWAIVVDAHNSINGPFDMEKSVRALEKAAHIALEKAASSKHIVFSEMRVGAGKVIPKDLGLKEGMGPGGIKAIVIEVEGEKTAYITIDGNNMVSGLREKLLSSLKEIGINHGEIFTTDTHAVNAVVLNRRGYHPIGEAIDHTRIISEVKRAVYEALRNMEPAEVAWHKVDIQGVKVIGEKRINELSLLTDNAFRKAKRNSIIFAVFGALLITIFAKI